MAKHSGQNFEIKKKKTKQKNFQPMKTKQKKKNEKQGQTKQKEVKVYYIGIQNFAQLPETWRTQQICWSIFVSCVHDLSHPKSQSNIMPSYCILFCAHGNLDVLKLLGMRW